MKTSKGQERDQESRKEKGSGRERGGGEELESEAGGEQKEGR